MRAGAGHHFGSLVAANDVGALRAFIGRALCLCFGAYLAVGFSLLFASAIAGGALLLIRTVQYLEHYVVMQ